MKQKLTDLKGDSFIIIIGNFNNPILAMAGAIRQKLTKTDNLINTLNFFYLIFIQGKTQQ